MMVYENCPKSDLNTNKDWNNIKIKMYTWNTLRKFIKIHLLDLQFFECIGNKIKSKGTKESFDIYLSKIVEDNILK